MADKKWAVQISRQLPYPLHDLQYPISRYEGVKTFVKERREDFGITYMHTPQGLKVYGSFSNEKINRR